MIQMQTMVTWFYILILNIIFEIIDIERLSWFHLTWRKGRKMSMWQRQKSQEISKFSCTFFDYLVVVTIMYW